LIKRLRILIPPGRNRPEKVLMDEAVEQGNELNMPQGVPLNWSRHGMNMGFLQIFSFDAPTIGHALALVDFDVRSAGRWTAQGHNIVEVEPGIPVRIEIEEAFSVGGGGSFTTSYSNLPLGRYTFVAIPVDEFGERSGDGVQLALTLRPPLQATWWFWTIAGAIGVAGLTGWVRYATWKRMHRQIEESERQHAIERERTRIARDIHDDMGARLTQISLVSSIALRKTPPGSPTHGDLKRMDHAAREVATALDEIVWAVNPAHDTLEGLGNYLSQYVTEALAAGEIRCRLEIPSLLPARFISSGTRHQLLMTAKEALNNAIKHSGASEIRVRLVYTENLLTITIADNGCGFDPDQPGTRNGIANMKQRLSAVGGTCDIQSKPGQGTTVTFRCILR